MFREFNATHKESLRENRRKENKRSNLYNLLTVLIRAGCHVATSEKVFYLGKCTENQLFMRC